MAQNYISLEDLDTLIVKLDELFPLPVEAAKEEKVFKCELEGMKFEGTPSQFEAFMKTLTIYMKKF
ncbi:hypothetical protein [Priestia megaterium]|uniref:hypothetical protein n=1 Tax=Priestia megaterium TaxID=1404 RepID=UPI002863BA77|nr:hypothetical protein [Priestia megaterium]MDR7207626.1 hypothetical protein [Priestia megaterium]